MLALFPYLKWLHVLGAIAALGANFTYPIWLRLARKDPSATRSTNKNAAHLLESAGHRRPRTFTASYFG